MFVEFVTGTSGFGRSRVEHIGRTKLRRLWYNAKRGSSFAGVLEPLWFGKFFLYVSDSFWYFDTFFPSRCLIT
jgi:hypothetical protein